PASTKRSGARLARATVADIERSAAARRAMTTTIMLGATTAPTATIAFTTTPTAEHSSGASTAIFSAGMPTGMATPASLGGGPDAPDQAGRRLGTNRARWPDRLLVDPARISIALA